jgi:DNA-binding transcriptional LysR family regulator
MTQSVDSLRWDDFKLVLAIARERSLSAAGARLGLNASTLSRRLDALEETLGAHLFDRTSGGVVPTELAEALVPAAEGMERAAADALRAVEGRETEPEGEVRITAPPGFASLVIAPALVRLAERHPRLRIALDASIGYADLTRREADIALRMVRPEGGDLVAKLVGEAPLVPLAARAFVEAHGPVEDLAELRWIVWGDDLAHLPDARWLRAQVPEDRIVLRTSSIEAQLRAMESGLGAALHVPHFVSAGAIAPLRLRPALAKRLPPFPRGQLWLVTHRALRQVPRVAVVWDFLAEELERARGAPAC